MKGSIAVVIVNWNGREDTLRCLESLQPIRSALQEVLLVDNASSDGLVELLEQNYPWVTCVRLPENMGFTGGNNAGIKRALEDGASYIWLLNNDTIVDPKVLRFLEGFTDPSVGACGSKIYFMKGREYHKDRYQKTELGHVLWYAGGVIDWDNMYASHRGVDEVDHGQYEVMEETPYITGCSMILKAAVVQKIGLLDPSYFLYLEDLEYCLRMQKYGYKTMYVPSSILWHKNAGSTGGAGSEIHQYYQTRNRVILGLTYAPFRTKWALIREGMRFILRGSRVQRKAIIDALIGKKGKQYA